MFERFTDRARRAMTLAQEEARSLYYAHVGSDHILLGLLREGEGVAVKVLEARGITLDAARQQVEALRPRPGMPADAVEHVPFTPNAKAVLEESLRQALKLGHNYIGTEHLLLAILRGPDRMAGRVLLGLGADFDQLRADTLHRLPGRGARLGSSPTGLSEDRSNLLRKINAVFDENDRLTREVARLRQRLEQHGIDSDNEPEDS
jgi:ATP-dependent Clp protease ATP-binding subunit ClpC